MQLILRALLLAVLMAHPFANWSQCNFFNPAVRLNRTTPNTITGTCQINLDLYFDLQANAGGKYVYVHIWPKTKYPNLTYTNPPTPAQLTDAVATMGFYHFGGSLYMLDVYAPSPGISNFKYTGLLIAKGIGTVNGSDRFTIQNISINGDAGCAVAQDFVADVWESQSASAQNVHCFSKSLKFFANDPQVFGAMICGPPRSFQFQVKTIDPVGISISYKVFVDNGDGVFNASNDNIQVASESDVSLHAGNNYTYYVGPIGYLPYSNQKPEADRALWIVVSSPTRDNEAYARLDNNCFLLPVALSRFEAFQVNGKALLKWTTSSEIDNEGFSVERKDQTDGGVFRAIGFVPSLSQQGNSQTELNYQYVDAAPLTSAVEYRLKQMDRSGKFSYSPIRFLNAKSLVDKVQPNPANTEVTLLLADRSTTYLIEWISGGGQKVGTWKANGRITIPTAQLPSGSHWIRITDERTGRTEQKKILIQHMQ